MSEMINKNMYLGGVAGISRTTAETKDNLVGDVVLECYIHKTLPLT